MKAERAVTLNNLARSKQSVNREITKVVCRHSPCTLSVSPLLALASFSLSIFLVDG